MAKGRISSFKGKIVQSSVGLWHKKLDEQIRIIKTKSKEEPLERFHSLEVSLAFLFLYLFLEATTDHFIENLCRYSMREEIAKEYRKGRRYLYGKIEFIFDNFCADLPYSEYVSLKKQLREITRIRNQVVHLEEMSWIISGGFDERHFEKPNDFTKLLTEQNLIKHYEKISSFFEQLVDLLQRGLKYEKYGAMVKIDGKVTLLDPDTAKDLVEHMAELSLPKMKKYADI